jgi:hypothetical protein
LAFVLIYALAYTGTRSSSASASSSRQRAIHKAPSFNDTIDLDTGPAELLFIPPVGPEKEHDYGIRMRVEF